MNPEDIVEALSGLAEIARSTTAILGELRQFQQLDPRTLAAIHAPPMPPKLVQAAVEATQDQPGNLDRLRALITEWQVGLADALLDRLAAPNGPSRKELIDGIRKALTCASLDSSVASHLRTLLGEPKP